MNTSRRTKIIAEGLALFAAFMDTIPKSLNEIAARQRWENWQVHHSEYVSFIREEQTRLFDKINAMF